VIRFITEWTESFEEFSQVAEEFRDADDKVLVRVLHRGRGKGRAREGERHSRGGALLARPPHAGGQAYQVDLYDNEAEALEAAGLRE
jgi:hypothetical protein